ncbi:protein of unknown function [Hyphomicrobium sp. 1Nfss2.1]
MEVKIRILKKAKCAAETAAH